MVSTANFSTILATFSVRKKKKKKWGEFIREGSVCDGGDVCMCVCLGGGGRGVDLQEKKTDTLFKIISQVRYWDWGRGEEKKWGEFIR